MHKNITKELAAALTSCLEQLDQMKGMFNDDDRAIAKAIDDAEKALAAYRVEEAKQGRMHYLDCSTTHVDEKDMELLACEGYSFGFTAASYEHGAFVSVYVMADEEINTPDELRKYGLSENFIKVYQYAAEQGFTVLRLDADGHKHPELPEGIWNE